MRFTHNWNWIPAFVALGSPLVLASACSSCGGSDAAKPAPVATPQQSAPPQQPGSSGALSVSSGPAPVPPGSSARGPGATHAGCKIYPSDNAWNTDVSGFPLDAELMSSVYPQMALGTGLHPDWGTVSDGYGIPITVGKAAAPAPLTFNTHYGQAETDKLPCASGGGQFCYPIPLDARTEGGGDKHILFLATDGAPDHCVLYELFNVEKTGKGFSVGSGAIFKLDSNALRPEGWTSADAAGLAIAPGLVRREEIEAGEIKHAIRFTMQRTQHGYIHPATHAAGKPDKKLPPMGLRLRLKGSFSEAGFSAKSLIIVRAMKKYGVMLADNGSNWYISGEMSQAWAPDMDALVGELKRVKGSDFEIVKTGAIVPQPD